MASMERYDFRTQRLFVEYDLKVDQQFEVDRVQANYLLNVLRLKEDAKILLFNGKDGEWLSTVSRSGRKSATVKILEQTRKQTSPAKLTYLFAPLKQARLDYMVQKAIEMGATTLQPVLTHHTQVSRINLERMRANAIEASEQCGILSIADCKEPIKLEKLVDQWNPENNIIFCDEIAAGKSAIEGLQSLKGNDLSVLIGPEGGFSKAERDLLIGKTFVHPISLGPRILRADTAAVAALTLAQAICGDMWIED